MQGYGDTEYDYNTIDVEYDEENLIKNIDCIKNIKINVDLNKKPETDIEIVCDSIQHELLRNECADMLNFLEEGIDDFSEATYITENDIDYEHYDVIDLITAVDIITRQPGYDKKTFCVKERIKNNIVKYIIDNYAYDEDHYDITFLDNYYCSIDDLINAPSNSEIEVEIMSILSKGGFKWERFINYCNDEEDFDNINKQVLAEHIILSFKEDIVEFIEICGFPRIYNVRFDKI